MDAFTTRCSCCLSHIFSYFPLFFSCWRSRYMCFYGFYLNLGWIWSLIVWCLAKRSDPFLGGREESWQSAYLHVFFYLFFIWHLVSEIMVAFPNGKWVKWTYTHAHMCIDLCIRKSQNSWVVTASRFGNSVFWKGCIYRKRTDWLWEAWSFSIKVEEIDKEGGSESSIHL